MWKKRQPEKFAVPLERKLLLAVIPIIIVSLLSVSVILYVVAKKNIQNKVSEYMEQYLVQLSTAIDNRLETSIQLNAQISVNAQLIEILQKYPSADYSQRLAYRQDVENIFITIMSIYDNIRGIYVFDRDGNEFYLRNPSGMDVGNLAQEAWYQEALDRQGAYVIFLDKRGMEENIGIARSIVDIYSRESYGVTLVEIPYSILEESIYGRNQAWDLQQGQILIQDERKELIYATDPEDTAWILEEDFTVKPGVPVMRVYRAPDGAEMIHILYVSEKTDWSYSYTCQMRYLMKDMKQIRLTVIVLVLAVTVFAVCIVIALSHRTIRPLGELVEAMQKMKEGDYAVQVDASTTDEFQYLSRTFNEMASSIRELIQKVYQAQLMQKEAQMEVLQQQINPHFLYNTFETMRGMALSEQNEKVADMIKNMSEFMRYNMYGSDGKAELQTEIRHVTNYIQIMDYRFDNKIQLTVHIPEEMQTLRIPKFTLQPLVENSVLHGFSEKKQGCEILILGQLHGSDAVLRIIDNGAGIADDLLEALNRELQKEEPAGEKTMQRTSIGVFNVNSRMKFNYGPQYGVCLFSRSSGGTIAEVKFPVTADAPEER